MEADMFISYELDLKGKRFEPVALDAELRATIGEDVYRGLSTYGVHKPVTVYVWGQATDELAAIIEAVGEAHVGTGDPIVIQPDAPADVPVDAPTDAVFGKRKKKE